MGSWGGRNSRWATSKRIVHWASTFPAPYSSASRRPEVISASWTGTPPPSRWELCARPARSNDGQGPVDFKISRGAKDKTLVEFKLAKNTHLKANLEKQTKIYEKASDAGRSIKVIFYFTNKELDRVNGILRMLGISGAKDIVLVDARRDNKPSGSKA